MEETEQEEAAAILCDNLGHDTQDGDWYASRFEKLGPGYARR